MANIKLPRYMRGKKLAAGKVSYFWEPPHWARPPQTRNGRACPVRSNPLGQNLAKAIETAEQLNEALDGWRTSQPSAVAATGSVSWLFRWYRGQRKFTKNTPKTQSDYVKIMDAVAAVEMKRGIFGQRNAGKVGPETADKLYEIFSVRGARQALYMVQVCRAVWNWAGRYSSVTGVAKGSNPFSGMAISYEPEEGNRPTSRAEYHKYCRKARELGFESMATAAALSFELVQRVWDAFGIPDPTLPAGARARLNKNRGIRWEDYKPGISITVRQSKTRKPIMIPLFDGTGEDGRIALYPELEAQLARVRPVNPTGLIVVEERNGKPYQHRRMSTVHRQICVAAGLPQEMKFTGFRHGGATEIGDAGEADIRSISGHTQLDTAAIYNKASQAKARRIGKLRRDHIAQITEQDDELSE